MTWVADDRPRRDVLRATIPAALASFLVSLLPLGTIVLVFSSMRLVQGITAVGSAVMMLPLLAGMLAGSVAGNLIVRRTAVYKPLLISTGLALLAAVLALSAIGPQSSQADIALRVAFTGLAMGAALRMFALMQQAGAMVSGLREPTRMAWITQLAGAVLGVGLFAAAFTHWLAPQLTRHVPLLPGEREHHLNLARAQNEAMDVVALRARVDSVLDGRLLVIERAYRGDSAAAEEILADVRLPEAMKAALRDGGIRARVHRHLTERAWHIESGLQAGEDGRNELLSDPLLPAGLKRQIADVPMRVFRDEDSSARVASLFRDAILAREDDVVAAATQHSLLSVRAAASAHAQELVERSRQGLKNAFAAAIAQTFAAAAWIVALAVLIVAIAPHRHAAPDTN